jgi:DNA-binding transcriptional LysR family regulator
MPAPETGSLPSLRALRAMTFVAREGSLARAAERLNVTPSAISHLLKDLERQLGVALFERTRTGVQPTEHGWALIAGIQEPLAQIESAMAAFRRDRQEVRLSTISTFASHWLIPRLPSFHAVRPEVRVSVFTTMHPTDFTIADIDCAIRFGRGEWPDLMSVPLFNEALAVVGLRSILRQIDSAELASSMRRTRIITVSTRPDELRIWWRGLGLDGPLPQPALTVETRAQAISGAMAGVGVTLVDPRFILAESRTDGLSVLDVKPVPLDVGYHLVMPARSASRKNVQLLKQWLLAEVERDSSRFCPANTLSRTVSPKI